MTIRDLLNTEIDIDVCDDYDESCYVCFCGKQPLTDFGEEVFAPIMDIEVSMYGDMAILHCDESNISLVGYLFKGAAGMISSEEWHRLFSVEQL